MATNHEIDRDRPADDSDGAGPAGSASEFIENVPVAKNLGAATVPFSTGRWREVTRASLAIGLTLLLASVILTMVVATINGFAVSDAKELLSTILSPLVGLVGAATGFYYGGRER